MNHFSENKDLYATVFVELKNIGVKVPKIKHFKSCVQKADKNTPPLNCKMFGISLYKQEWVYDLDYPLPKFLAIATTYLLNFSKTLGLFRKSGSLVRQRNLRLNLEKGEDIEGSDPNDVASLLKQWLRELPEPLIPIYMQDLFVRCQHLVNKQDCTAASLLCCLLLPPLHLHPLKHLMCFLKRFAAHSNENKMGSHNLALMMAPNIFISRAESISKPCSILIQLHTSTIELLIENAEHIGDVPQSVSLKYSLPLKTKGPELVSSGVALDYSPSKLTKKIKNDLVSGIRKLVGQNSTSTSASEKYWHSPKMVCRPMLSSNAGETLSTPLRKEDKQTLGARSLSNRTRRKSFGLLRRKDRSRKNSNKRSSLTKRNQVLTKVNSNSKNVSKRNSITKAQESESGSAVSEFSDSSSPQGSPEGNYCLAACEVPSINGERNQLTENDKLDDTPFRSKIMVTNNKLELNEVDQISPEKFEGFNCQRKLFTNCDNSPISPIDVESVKFIDETVRDSPSNSADIQSEINDGASEKLKFSSKTSLKIRKSDIERLGQLKSNCVDSVPVKSSTPYDIKNLSKKTFEVGHLEMKTQQESLNKAKDICSNYKATNRFGNRSNSSLNRSQSFMGDSKWRTESQCSKSTKTSKKTVRSSSLIRGKPNTVKSGLPNQRQHRDNLLTPKSDAIIKVSNETGKKQTTLSIPLKNTPERITDKYSLEKSPISNSGKYNLQQSKSNGSAINKESSKDLFFISPTNKDSLNTLTYKSKGRLSLPLSLKEESSKSGSKIPRFDYSTVGQKKMDSADSEKCSISRRLSSENSRIPLLRTASTSDSEASLNNSLFFTPNQTLQTSSNSTGWVSGNQFLECISTPQSESFNKRESIAMILKNNTGHVRDKVQLYNNRDVNSCPTPNSSPATYQNTPCRRSFSHRQVPSSKNHKPFSVLQRSESSSKGMNRKERVKISSKYFLSDSKTSSNLESIINHPLKEVTNINFDLNGKQNTHYDNTPIRGKGKDHSQQQERQICSDNVLSRSLLKRNSFAGRTPAKLSKRVSRSESSPNCPRPGARLIKTLGNTYHGDQIKVERNSSFSPVTSHPSYRVKKSDSSLSTRRLKHDDLVDEWLCEF